MTEFDRDTVHWHNNRQVRCRDASDLMASTTDKKKELTCETCRSTLIAPVSLLDVYEAMGVPVDHETNSVEVERARIGAHFKIQLDVSLIGVRYLDSGAVNLELRLHIPARVRSGLVEHFDRELTLPLDSLRIVKED